jgi:hypothetical protein
MAMLPCADCDEFFVKAESLELHRSTRHAGKQKKCSYRCTFLNLFKQITH